MVGIGECDRISRELWEFVDGRLDPALHRRVASHLESCARCRAAAADLDAAADLFRSYREEAHVPDIDDWSLLRTAINSSSAPHRMFGPRRTRAYQLLGIAGAALCAIALILVFSVRTIGKNPLVLVRNQSLRPERINPSTHQESDQKTRFIEKNDRQITLSPGNRYRTHKPLPIAPLRAAASPTPAIDDLRYLNPAPAAGSISSTASDSGSDTALNQYAEHLTRTGDDFVKVAAPRVAGASREAIAAAASAYAQEKQVVDSRLARKITLAVKGMSLAGLCTLMQDKTQVEVRAARSVGDEKVTVFCDDMPARDIMRAINQTFEYSWARTGDESGYRYELSQDLRSRLLEEELRARDLNEALLALNDALGASNPRIGSARGGKAQGSPFVQLFAQLSPEDKAALRNGRRIILSTSGEDPGHKIPDSLRRPVLATFGIFKVSADGRISNPDAEGTPLVDLPGARAMVGFHLAHTDLGEVTLQESTACRYPTSGGAETGVGSPDAFGLPVLSVRSPSTDRIDNAKLNIDLKGQAELRGQVSWLPEPGCPLLKRGEVTPDRGGRFETMEEFHTSATYPTPIPHVSSADVWEEIHRKTGLPIVADYYTRVYPTDGLSAVNVPLFDALCRTCDRLGVRWRKEGQIVIGRSASWFWNKLKETPNRQLAHWREDGRTPSGLPFADLLEMVQLSDPQLESTIVATGIRHCEEIPEWDLVHVDSTGVRTYSLVRRGVLRSLTQLPQAARREAFEPNGIAFRELPPAVQETMFGGLAAANHALSNIMDSRIHVDYVPHGRYIWNHRADLVHDGVAESALPVISASTPEKALELARQRDPMAGPQNISKTTNGILGITVIYKDGTMWAMGKPENSLR